MIANVNIDLLIVTLFLLLNLAVGIWYGRHTKSIHDFALGGQNFSTATLTATLVITYSRGDDILIYLHSVFTHGLPVVIIFLIGYPIYILINYYIILPNIACFLGKKSIVDIFDQLYGKLNGLIAAVLSIAICLCIVIAQVRVCIIVFHSLFNIQGTWAVIASTIVVITYSAFGGIRSIMLTDFLQALFIGVFLPLILILVWESLGSKNCDTLINNITNQLSDPIGLITINWVALLISNALPYLDPAFLRATLLAKDINQAKTSFIFFSLIYAAIHIIVICIGIILQATNINFSYAQIIYIIDQCTLAIIGLKGVIGIAVLAMTMSSIDSYINVAAVILATNIWQPLGIINRLNELQIVKICSVVVGLVSMYIAFYLDKLLEVSHIMAMLAASTVMTSLLITSLGFRVNNIVVTLGIVTSIITQMLWYFMKLHRYYNVDATFSGLLSHILVVILLHYGIKTKKWWKKHNSRSKNIRLI